MAQSKKAPRIIRLRCGCTIRERPEQGDWIVERAVCGTHSKGRSIGEWEVRMMR